MPWHCNDPPLSLAMMMMTQLVAAAVVAAVVVVLPLRSCYRPRMLPLPWPLPLATQAPPPAEQRCGGGRLLVKLAQDMEQWGGWVSEVIWGGMRIVGGTRILLAK